MPYPKTTSSLQDAATVLDKVMTAARDVATALGLPPDLAAEADIIHGRLAALQQQCCQRHQFLAGLDLAAAA